MDANTTKTTVWSLAFACSQLLACSSQTSVTPGAQPMGATTSPSTAAAPAAVGSATVPPTPATSMSMTPVAMSTGVAGSSVASSGGRGGASSVAAVGGAGTVAGAAGRSAAASGTSGATAGASGTVAMAGAGGAGTTPATAEAPGCDGAKLLVTPDDPGARGPWAVGAKTVTLKLAGGMTTVEVWYPAQLGSEAGKTKAGYDLTEWLSASDKAKIPAAENTPQPCDCYRDLPIDAAHGPYPAVVFAHGLAAFRTGSLTTMTHWASRGFIVLAADHLGFNLRDFAASQCGGQGSGVSQISYLADINAEIAALKSKPAELSFLGDRVDSAHIGAGGHSMGAGTGATAVTGVQAIVLLAELLGASPSASPGLKGVVSIAGMDDSVTTYAATASAYDGAPQPKWLVGIKGGDHLDVIDICSQTNEKGQTSLDVGMKNGVCAINAVLALAHCGTMSEPKQGPGIVNYVSTAVLEQALQCKDRSAELADAALKAKFSAVAEYKHSP